MKRVRLLANCQFLGGGRGVHNLGTGRLLGGACLVLLILLLLLLVLLLLLLLLLVDIWGACLVWREAGQSRHPPPTSPILSGFQTTSKHLKGRSRESVCRSQYYKTIMFADRNPMDIVKKKCKKKLSPGPIHIFHCTYSKSTTGVVLQNCELHHGNCSFGFLSVNPV